MAQDRDLDFEEYYRLGVLAALYTMKTNESGRSIHAAGYCLGGTLLATAAAALARDGDKRLKTITLFRGTDVVDTSAWQITSSSSTMRKLASSKTRCPERGYLDARQMASAFELLRSNNLIW